MTIDTKSADFTSRVKALHQTGFGKGQARKTVFAQEMKEELLNIANSASMEFQAKKLAKLLLQAMEEGVL